MNFGTLKVLNINTETVLLNYKLVYNYLGYGNKTPDSSVFEKIQKCDIALKNELSFKVCYVYLPINTCENTVDFTAFSVNGISLAKNLNLCKSACIFAATLGIGADRLINKASVYSQTDAVIYNAIGSAYAEQLAEYLNGIISSETKENGLFTRPRFSPGYGDFNIKYQSDILRLLNAEKNIGLTVTESNMLLPVKSVTAVVGISDKKVNCKINKCNNCTLNNCPYRS